MSRMASPGFVSIDSLLNPPAESNVQRRSSTREQHCLAESCDSLRARPSQTSPVATPLAQQPLFSEPWGCTAQSVDQKAEYEQPNGPHPEPAHFETSAIFEGSQRASSKAPGVLAPSPHVGASSSWYSTARTPPSRGHFSQTVDHTPSHSPYSPSTHAAPTVSHHSMPVTNPVGGRSAARQWTNSNDLGTTRSIEPQSDNRLPDSEAIRSVRQEDHGAIGLIPCVVDRISGSSAKAKQRKANSEASRRVRRRKINEIEMKARLADQGNTISNLLQQRDHYLAERDFFRDQLSQFVPLSQLGPRPLSPHKASSTFAQGAPEPCMSDPRGAVRSAASP